MLRMGMRVIDTRPALLATRQKTGCGKLRSRCGFVKAVFVVPAISPEHVSHSLELAARSDLEFVWVLVSEPRAKSV